jgi:hypothetical protein
VSSKLAIVSGHLEHLWINLTAPQFIRRVLKDSVAARYLLVKKMIGPISWPCGKSEKGGINSRPEL